MSCVATPAHASESFEWRIRQRSRGLTCVSRASRRRRTALFDLHDLLESTIELYARVNQIRMYLFFAQEYGENNLQ